jgi:hypothetical protein
MDKDDWEDFKRLVKKREVAEEERTGRHNTLDLDWIDPACITNVTIIESVEGGFDFSIHFVSEYPRVLH